MAYLGDRNARLRDRLGRLSLFSELEGPDLRRLAGLSRILPLSKKEVLFTEGEPYRGMYVVLDGLAVVYKSSSEGRMLILRVCRPGDSLAEVPLFEGAEARYPADARTTRDSRILFLPREQFAPFLRRHPEVAWKLLEVLARQLKEMSVRLEGVTLREVTSRLARYLLKEVEAAGSGSDERPVLTLPLAKGSLASYLGTVHETLSRTFARLVRAGILEVHGPRVTILDPARLRRFAEPGA